MNRLTLATLKLSAAKQGEQSEYYDDDAGQDGDNDHYYGGQVDDDHAEQYDEWLWWWFILTLNGFFSSSMQISCFIPDLSATDTVFLFLPPSLYIYFKQLIILNVSATVLARGTK